MPAKGVSMTEGQKRKIADAQRGVPRKALSAKHRLLLIAANTGRPQSADTREKKRLSKLGGKNPQFGQPAWNSGKKTGPNPEHSERMKGRPSWNKGKKCPGTAAKLVGRVHPFKPRPSRVGKAAGSANPNWKGGVTPERNKLRNSPSYVAWRNAVFARDGFACRKYLTSGGDLEAHHIQNFAEYPSLRFDVGNGVTLSRRAHAEFHAKYGKTNNTCEQLLEFLAAPVLAQALT